VLLLTRATQLSLSTWPTFENNNSDESFWEEQGNKATRLLLLLLLLLVGDVLKELDNEVCASDESGDDLALVIFFLLGEQTRVAWGDGGVFLLFNASLWFSSKFALFSNWDLLVSEVVASALAFCALVLAVVVVVVVEVVLLHSIVTVLALWWLAALLDRVIILEEIGCGGSVDWALDPTLVISFLVWVFASITLALFLVEIVWCGCLDEAARAWSADEDNGADVSSASMVFLLRALPLVAPVWCDWGCLWFWWFSDDFDEHAVSAEEFVECWWVSDDLDERLCVVTVAAMLVAFVLEFELLFESSFRSGVIIFSLSFFFVVLINSDNLKWKKKARDWSKVFAYDLCCYQDESCILQWLCVAVGKIKKKCGLDLISRNKKKAT